MFKTTTNKTTNRTKMTPRESTRIILYWTFFVKVYGIYIIMVHELVKLLITVCKLTKLLIIDRKLAHKAAQRYHLYPFTLTHKQFRKHCELLTNFHELGGTFLQYTIIYM